MRFQQLTVTLTGAAQQLVLLAGGKTPLRSISIQADPANAAVVKIGDSRITSSDYAIILPIPTSSVPAAPFIVGDIENGALYLEDLYVLGAVNEKIHLGLWIYV